MSYSVVKAAIYTLEKSEGLQNPYMKVMFHRKQGIEELHDNQTSKKFIEGYDLHRRYTDVGIQSLDPRT